MADFEDASVSAFREVLGSSVVVSDCWFHFSQATIKRVLKVGLKDRYRNAWSAPVVGLENRRPRERGEERVHAIVVLRRTTCSKVTAAEFRYWSVFSNSHCFVVPVKQRKFITRHEDCKREVCRLHNNYGGVFSKQLFMSRRKLSWRWNARRRFKFSALCVGGWFFAAISSAANCGGPCLTITVTLARRMPRLIPSLMEMFYGPVRTKTTNTVQGRRTTQSNTLTKNNQRRRREVCQLVLVPCRRSRLCSHCDETVTVMVGDCHSPNSKTVINWFTTVFTRELLFVFFTCILILCRCVLSFCVINEYVCMYVCIKWSCVFITEHCTQKRCRMLNVYKLYLLQLFGFDVLWNRSSSLSFPISVRSFAWSAEFRSSVAPRDKTILCITNSVTIILKLI